MRKFLFYMLALAILAAVPAQAQLIPRSGAGAGGGGGGAVTIPVSGTAFFAITDTAIAAASQNFAFGFTSKKIILSAPASNSADVCIDHQGGTAICPAGDTAGDDRLAPGDAMALDDHQVTSISAIAASGTQTVVIRAFN